VDLSITYFKIIAKENSYSSLFYTKFNHCGYPLGLATDFGDGCFKYLWCGMLVFQEKDIGCFVKKSNLVCISKSIRGANPGVA
jgi:hypothetical protein